LLILDSIILIGRFVDNSLYFSVNSICGLFGVSSGHLSEFVCFRRGILHRNSTGYVLLPNFVLSGLCTEQIFNLSVGVLLESRHFTRWDCCVTDACVLSSGNYLSPQLDGGRSRTSVHMAPCLAQRLYRP